MNSINNLLITAGIWRAVLLLPAGELPFTLEVKETKAVPVIYIKNGDEKIEVNDITTKGDSVFIKLPVFDSEIKAKISEKLMSGEWINYSRKTNQSIPFRAEYGLNYRFQKESKATVQLPEKWEVHFSPATKDSSFAIGLFKQAGSGLTGTFLTTTGDYRFLEGCVDKDSLFLSCFDGAHAYLFKAKIENGSKITGKYYSGNHWEEPWEAFINDKAELPDAYSITFLKNDSTPFSFDALTTDSSKFVFPNEKFKNKVVVIQIMGSWCPNCMDETAFFSDYFTKNKQKPVSIIGLSFEKTSDFKKASSNVLKVKKRFNVEYEMVVAGNRDVASEKMSMLSKINGYPTTIFIDKKGEIRKIHTGFNGPATGKYYEKEKDNLNTLLVKLLAE